MMKSIVKLMGVVTISFLLLTGITGCQSRAISRITGNALELKLPSDFKEPVSFASGREGEKDLFYVSTDGEYKVKTYTDWGIMEAEIVFVNKGTLNDNQ